MKYGVMEYDVMKYDVMKYDIMKYDVMKHDIMKYDVMKYDILKNKEDLHIAGRHTALDIFCFAVFFYWKPTGGFL